MSEKDFNDILNSDEEFTLESILAEYKGDAFIEGDRKTSKALLDKRADSIITESRTGTLEKTALLQEIEKEGGFFDDILDPFDENPKPKAEAEEKPKGIRQVIDITPAKEEPADKASGQERKKAERNGNADTQIINIGSIIGRLTAEDGREEKWEKEDFPADFDAGPDSEKIIHAEEREADYSEPDSQSEPEEETEKKRASFGGFVFNLRVKAKQRSIAKKAEKEKQKNASDDSKDDTVKQNENTAAWFSEDILEDSTNTFDEEPREEDDGMLPEDLQPEPNYKSTAARLLPRVKRRDFQAKASLVIAFLMAIFTILAERGVLGDNGRLFTTILFISQVVVTILTIDVTLYGIIDIVRFRIGAESLLLLATVFGFIYNAQLLLTGKYVEQMPVSAVNALALAFYEWSGYRRTLAEYVSMKTAAAAQNPSVMTACYQPDMQKTLIGCSPAGLKDGFYNKLYSADVSEKFLRFYCPAAIIVAVISGAAASKISGNSTIFCIALIAAAGAGFSLDTVYALPFSTASLYLKKKGCALGGWKACTEIAASDGYALSCSDLFPNSANVVGIECLNNFKPDRVIKYASSLLIDADSAFAPAFDRLLHKQGVTKAEASEIEILEGGFSGKIRSDKVTVGSVACMNLISAGIPAELKLQNAVYLVINGMPAGIFTLDYIPEKSIFTAVGKMLHCGCYPYLASTDFNVSPIMVSQKYKISVEDIGYLSLKESYGVRTRFKEKQHAALAVMNDGSFSNTAGIFSYVPKILRAVKGSLSVAVICSFVGICALVLICATTASANISISNILEFLLIIEAVVILIGRLSINAK